MICLHKISVSQISQKNCFCSLALFRIANTGTEIPEEHENRIFDRFYRADPSRSSDFVGSGLGLSICREIVLAHAGRIWLERPKPGWTAFVLTLPCPENL